MPVSRRRREAVRVVSDGLALSIRNVPCPAEWMEAWAVMSEVISLRKGSRAFDESLGAFASVMHMRRRRHRHQLRLTADVLIREARKVLLQATSISLDLYEPSYRNVIRVRADLPVRRAVAAVCAMWALRVSALRAC